MEAVWTQAGRQSQPEAEDDAAQYQEVGAWVCAQGGEVTSEEARAQFPDVGNMSSALSRAAAEGIIRRTRRGVYAAPDHAPAANEVTYTEPYTGTPFAPPTPARAGLREWLEAGVEAGHLTKQAAALLFWERSA